jgi:hypothetical protein
MTRGIHLKHLTATDLGLLGLPEEAIAEGIPQDAGQGARAAELAGEVDPVLSRLTREVRVTLEETLLLLDQALGLGQGCRSG